MPYLLQVLAVTLATRLAALLAGRYTFDDEAVYSAIASRMLEGELPFAGAVDHKPPAIAVTYALVYAVFGRNQLFPVRALLLVVVVATALVVARLAARLVDERAARTAGLLYAVASVWGLQFEVQAANCELFLNLPLACAAYLVPGPWDPPVATGGGARREPLWRALGAGALTGVAGLFKYQAALAGVGWVVTLLAARSVPPRQRIVRVAALALGFGGVALAYVATLRVLGIWDAFAFWGWRYNFEYMGVMSAGEQLVRALLCTGAVALFWIPLWAGMTRPPEAMRWTVLPWLGASLLIVIPGGRFFFHYYLVALAPLCLLASPGMVAAGRRARLARGLVVTFAGLALVVSFVFPEDGAGPDRRRTDATARRVAAWVRDHTAQEDRIFVWGGPESLYHLADRVMATRFPSSVYQTGKIWGTRLAHPGATGTERYIVARAWSELLEDLERAPPRFIVDAAAAGLYSFEGHSIARYPSLAEFVARRYRRETTVDGVPVFSRLP